MAPPAPPTSPPYDSADAGIAALVSQVLVAYTIELDNQFELRMQAGGHSGAPLSLAIWSRLMRYIPEAGIAVSGLISDSRTAPERVRMQLGCLERWGFISLLAPPGKEMRIAKHRLGGQRRDGWGSGRGIRGDWKVRLTPQGLAATGIWPTLLEEIDARWAERFGKTAIGRLRKSLEAIASRGDKDSPPGQPLPMLFSRLLKKFREEFERESDVALDLCANAIRILGPEPIPESEIPRRTGASPETSGIGWQLKRFILVESDPARRGKIVRLNDKGLLAQQKYHQRISEIEDRWSAEFGKEIVRQLRASLQDLFAAKPGEPPRIAAGLIPPPDVMRAGAQLPALGRRDIGSAARQRRRDIVVQTQFFIRDPAGTLPHYPLWDMNRGFGP
jgi:hypothetical protein